MSHRFLGLFFVVALLIFSSDSVGAQILKDYQLEMRNKLIYEWKSVKTEFGITKSWFTIDDFNNVILESEEAYLLLLVEVFEHLKKEEASRGNYIGNDFLADMINYLIVETDYFDENVVLFSLISLTSRLGDKVVSQYSFSEKEGRAVLELCGIIQECLQKMDRNSFKYHGFELGFSTEKWFYEKWEKIEQLKKTIKRKMPNASLEAIVPEVGLNVGTVLCLSKPINGADQFWRPMRLDAGIWIQCRDFETYRGQNILIVEARRSDGISLGIVRLRLEDVLALRQPPPMATPQPAPQPVLAPTPTPEPTPKTSTSLGGFPE